MNQIQIINKFKDLDDDQITKVCRHTLKILEIDNRIVEIESVSEDKIKETNHKYRKINKPTDVISFPLAPTPNKRNILGNIYVCESIAGENDIPVEELIKHGLLHLAGFDHEVDNKKWNREAIKINHHIKL